MPREFDRLPNGGRLPKPDPVSVDRLPIDRVPITRGPVDEFPKADGLTGYAAILKRENKYPLKPRPTWRERKVNRERPVPTPFLVIPNYPGDQGTARPLNPTQARHSGAIEILDSTTHTPVTTPVMGKTYTLRCQVENHGAVGCFAGIAEFYVAAPAQLDALAVGAGPRPAPIGYAGVMVPPGGKATATCQRTWTVTDANSGILVRIYDPLVDRPQHPYDSATDRHVARRDPLPDFTGTYAGTYKVQQFPAQTYQVKIVIQQTGAAATVSVYEQVSGGLPAVPQITGTAMVTGNSFAFDATEMLGGKPFTQNHFTFTLLNPNLLRFTNHRTYMPGDSRAPQDLSGDLPRV